MRARNDPFRVVAEAMPQLAWLAAPDGTVEYFNQPWLEYTGITVERMLEAGGKGVVHPDDLELTLSRWSKALATGLPYEVQYRLRSMRDGTYRWFLARTLPIRDDAGNIVNWIGTATDIDAQVRANENLRFMLNAANALAPLLDVRRICHELATLAVSRIADSCFITLAGNDGTHELAAAAHRDERRRAQLEDLQVRHGPTAGSAVKAAMERNLSTLLPAIDTELMRGIAVDAEHANRLRDLSIKSLIVVPIIQDGGKTFGTMTLLASEGSRTFTGEDLAVAQSVARYAASAISTARAYDRERRRAARLRFIARASELLFESFDLQATFEHVLELLVHEVADFAAIFLAEHDGALRTAAASHRDPELKRTLARIAGQRIFRAEAEKRALDLLASRRSRIFANVTSFDLAPLVWEYLAHDADALHARTVIAVPLDSHGETLGALAVCWTDPHRTGDPEETLLLEDLARRLCIAIEHSRTMERERRIAQSLQRALLPAPGAFPVAAGLRFDAEYRSSSGDADVGGDWYDAITLPDGSIAVSVGDVTGRGLQAATLMGKLRQALAMATLYEKDPARALDLVDYSLRARGSPAIATAFLAIINPERSKLTYASAGHPPPLLRRSTGRPIELRSDGLPLGLRDVHQESSEEVSLENTILLLLYTDGLTDGKRDSGAGERRLRNVASSSAILNVRNAARFACDACSANEAHDDTAVLTVRFGEAANWSFDAENAQAAHEARNELIAYLRGHASPGNDFEAAELVFGELVGNVVRHAPGPIDVRVDWTADFPVLHVIDRGKGVVRSPSLPENPLSESGRGLYIVSLLTRSLRVERIPGYGNHVAAELAVTRL